MHCGVEVTESSPNKQHHLFLMNRGEGKIIRVHPNGFMVVDYLLFLQKQKKGIVISGTGNS
jgi:hypothetical protein